MSSTTLLAGGVGGARLARGLAAVHAAEDLTIIVNVGDDDRMYGAHVSADLDTVTYTLAGIEGPHGWGRADDTFTVMKAMEALGEDTTFRLGDADLATCLARTSALDRGEPLSSITRRIAAGLGVVHRLLPATDDAVPTRLQTVDGPWLSFQEYFVIRGHRDEIRSVRYEGTEQARPAPMVLEAIASADTVVIAPSNPPLSIGPILAIPGIAEAVQKAHRVIAVSPLFRGRALKGPADRVMASLGLPAGNAGVLAAYDGLLSTLVVDAGDSDDAATLSGDVEIRVTDTHIADRESATRFANWMLESL